MVLLQFFMILVWSIPFAYCIMITVIIGILPLIAFIAKFIIIHFIWIQTNGVVAGSYMKRNKKIIYHKYSKPDIEFSYPYSAVIEFESENRINRVETKYSYRDKVYKKKFRHGSTVKVSYKAGNPEKYAIGDELLTHNLPYILLDLFLLALSLTVEYLTYTYL